MDRPQAVKLLKRATKAGSKPASAMLRHVELTEAKERDRRRQGSGASPRGGGEHARRVVEGAADALASEIDKWKGQEAGRMSESGKKARTRRKR